MASKAALERKIAYFEAREARRKSEKPTSTQVRQAEDTATINALRREVYRLQVALHKQLQEAYDGIR